MKLFIEDNGIAILIGQDNDEAPTGYSDSTNIISIATNTHLQNILPYNSIRDWIQTEMVKKDADYATAFGLCSIDEKKWVCRYQLMPYSVRMQLISDSEDKVYWDKLVELTEGSPVSVFTGRSLIYQKLRKAVSNYVRREIWYPNDYIANLSNAQAFLKEVHLLKEYYIASNAPDFGDFLHSRNSYELTGFNSKGYWLQDLEDELKLIYNGNF